MGKIKVLHTADLHFSNKAAKLVETTRVSNFILDRAEVEQPDVAVIAGDLVDEHDGAIRIDSDAARAAIAFVENMAEICPVLIVRGTRSHDRETPYLFGKIRAKHAVHVSSQIELVGLTQFNEFIQIEGPGEEGLKAVFTTLPSPDKANLIAAFGADSISASNLNCKEVMNDALGYLGTLNDQIDADIPRILVGHGMITGSQYSSGSISTGEDFEYALGDLALTRTDIKLFGHVHKFQTFPGNVFYSGSPGRLNMGETEVKGFLVHTMTGRTLKDSRFVETPARQFLLIDVPWDEAKGVEGIFEAADECERNCDGAEVRFRYQLPKDMRHLVNREGLIMRFTAAGAILVKIELSCIQEVTQRAEGISQLENLRAKGEKYADVNNETLNDRELYILETIEGRDVEELIEDAKRAIYGVQEEKPVVEETVSVASEENLAEENNDNEQQFALFG